jgi:hypothetical protein
VEYFIVAALAGALLFVILHLRPLTDHEIAILGAKRRKCIVEAHFYLEDTERSVNAAFKKSLNPRGIFYRVELPLSSVASTVAGLLKYKKHEWVVVAFEKGKHVGHLWVNKGHDNSSVSIYLPPREALDTAIRNGYSSVLIFHNHPNSNPGKYNCTQASDADIVSASHWASTLNKEGVNLAEYICERGQHYRYFLSPSDSFMPLRQFTNDITKVNGSSRLGNLRLHMERIL